MVKISQVELQFITGTDQIESAAGNLMERYPITLILIIMGNGGSYAFYKSLLIKANAFSLKITVEITGAGDTLHAGILSFMLDHGLENLGEEYLSEMLKFANTAAAIITTRRGVLAVMPELKEIMQMLLTEK